MTKTETKSNGLSHKMTVEEKLKSKNRGKKQKEENQKKLKVWEGKRQRVTLRIRKKVRQK